MQGRIEPILIGHGTLHASSNNCLASYALGFGIFLIWSSLHWGEFISSTQPQYAVRSTQYAVRISWANKIGKCIYELQKLSLTLSY